MKKKILIIGIAGLVVLVIIVALLFSNANSIARSAIVKALEYVLQTDVSLEKVDLKITEGSVKLEKLVIKNPSGYETPEFFSVDDITVKADINSFRTDEPVINLISINSPKITVEKKGDSSNVNQLIDNASRFDTGEGGAKEDEEGKQIKIDKVVVDGANATLHAKLLLTDEVSVDLPRIELNDIGGKDSDTSYADAIKVFMAKVMEQILKTGGGLIPDEFGNVLSGGIGTALEGAGKAAETLKEGVGSVGEKALDGGKSIGEGIGNVGKGIGGLFNKNKSESTETEE